MATPDDIHSPTPSDREESQVRLAASLTLGGVMAGHVLLETACDALFLANVSVERLPLVTIAVALLALGISRTQATSEHRRTLLALQSAAAVGTLAFFFLIRVSGDWAYYVLYVWSGVITSVIVVRFWLLLGEYFTIIQAKRLFAAIAMGGSLGALFGSGAAAGLAPQVGGEGLLIGSALAYGVSAFGPGMLLHPVSRSAPSATGLERGDASGLGASLHGVLDSPYACRVALIVVFAGMTLTLGDYLFKSVLTEEVAAADLATILARIYLGLNVLSIGMLVNGVSVLRATWREAAAGLDASLRDERGALTTRPRR